MRLAKKCLKLSALVGLLGLSVWAMGCGEPAPSVSPKSNGGDPAGSATGGGVDVPEMPADTGAAKPETDAAKEDPKADEPKADEPKAVEGEQAKKDAPAADEAKADEAKKDESKPEDKKE